MKKGLEAALACHLDFLRVSTSFKMFTPRVVLQGGQFFFYFKEPPLGRARDFIRRTGGPGESEIKYFQPSFLDMEGGCHPLAADFFPVPTQICLGLMVLSGTFLASKSGDGSDFFPLRDCPGHTSTLSVFGMVEICSMFCFAFQNHSKRCSFHGRSK